MGSLLPAGMCVEEWPFLFACQLQDFPRTRIYVDNTSSLCFSQDFYANMNTNNLTEAINRVMKAKFFALRHNRRVDSLLATLTKEVLPYYKNNYIANNKK